MNTALKQLGIGAKKAARQLMTAGVKQKNDALYAMADALEQNCEEILAENAHDTASAHENGIREVMLDRLTLTKARISQMADGIRQVAAFSDPVGKVLEGNTMPNGLRIEKITVPLGVIGIIYESRPNVTSDAAALCIKAGNATILRGGKEAIRSNSAIVRVMRKALKESGMDENCVSLIEDTSRETATEMMRMNKYIDCLIPRGGAGLIASVVANATIPVIETGVGNCHIYVEKTADLDMAADIIFNAKTSRVSVCNAMESLLVDRKIAKEALEKINERLQEKSVTIYGCPETCAILPHALPATEEDYGREYLDYMLSCKVVSGRDEAIDHIAKYSTGHSESIITRDYNAAEDFVRRVDSAAVYVNASTRFSDGGEFGLGAEIGISTQKLHARGPMGVAALTSTKYIIRGNGQVR